MSDDGHGSSDSTEAFARLQAESDIRNLVGRLGHLADDGDIDEYLSLWCEDGSWGHADDAPIVGLEALRAGVEARRRDGVQGPGTASRHINTTLWVAIDGPDEAHSQSYFQFLNMTKKGNWKLVLAGRYDDTYRRTDAGWKIATRHITQKVN